jgi:hypothetical protein
MLHAPELFQGRMRLFSGTWPLPGHSGPEQRHSEAQEHLGLMGQYQSHGLVTEMHPQLLIHDFLASTEKKSPETAGPVRGSRVTPCNPPPTGGFFVFAPCKTVLQKCDRFVPGVLSPGHGAFSRNPGPWVTSQMSWGCHWHHSHSQLATAHDQTSRTYQF